MSPVEMTALARVPEHLLAGAARRGVDRSELLELSGLSEAELADPDARVSVRKIWNLWRAVIDRVEDPALGIHLVEELDTRDFGLVGYVAHYSRTLREALSRIARYSRIVNELMIVHLSDDEDPAKILCEPSPHFDALRHPVDARLSWTLATARELTGAQIVPVEVRLPYPKPADTWEHRRFFRAPLKFDQPEAGLLLQRSDLDRKAKAADATLSGYLDGLADGVLKSLNESVTFRDRVRRAIWTELSSGSPSVRHVATQLGTSPRTLQRRLGEESTTFAAELDALRREMATKLLQDRSLAVYEVAFLLGYSEPSTFYRAFRRWTRVSPQQFRSATG